MQYTEEVVQMYSETQHNSFRIQTFMYTWEAELSRAIEKKTEGQKKSHHPPPYLIKNFISLIAKK